VTLAFGEIVRSLFRNAPAELFGGTLSMSTPRYDRNSLFIIGFVLVLITVIAIQNFIRSKHGRAVTAIRDSEIAARATGINVTKYKLMVFTLSAFFAGIAGVLFSYSQFGVDSKKFDYNYSIQILVMVVLGGMGNIGGSLIAATAVVILDTFLQKQLTGNMAVLKDMLYALILIGLVVYRNAPALKSFREKFSIKNLLHRLRRYDPAKVHDDEAKWDRVPTKIMVDEVLSVDIQPKSPYTPDKQWKEDE
jgi:branched-chain amino acid transport system permease protein